MFYWRRDLNHPRVTHFTNWHLSFYGIAFGQCGFGFFRKEAKQQDENEPELVEPDENEGECNEPEPEFRAHYSGLKSLDISDEIDKRREVQRACELYRHFDRDGQLLYVGISRSAMARLSQHRRSAEWYPQVANVTVERFATREAALKAETAAIKNERPLHNKVHNAACGEVLLRA